MVKYSATFSKLHPRRWLFFYDLMRTANLARTEINYYRFIDMPSSA